MPSESAALPKRRFARSKRRRRASSALRAGSQANRRSRPEYQVPFGSEARRNRRVFHSQAPRRNPSGRFRFRLGFVIIERMGKSAAQLAPQSTRSENVKAPHVFAVIAALIGVQLCFGANYVVSKVV